MKLDLPDEDVEFLFNLVMDAPVARRRTDRIAFVMAEQMQAYQAERAAAVAAPAAKPPEGATVQ
jgi:hypothetical protein